MGKHCQLARHFGAALFLLGSLACQPDGGETTPPLGHTESSTHDLHPGGSAAFEGRSLAEISERGRELHRLERMWGLAHEVGLPRVGSVRADVLLPLAQVDEGGRSGEVVFYRFVADAEATPDELDPLEATRWLVVPVLFEPDRVLENEQFSDPVQEDSEAHHRLQAFLLAAKAGRERAPQGSWRIYTFREFVQHTTRRVPQTRVYMLGNDGAPDLEVVVSDARRRHPAAVIQVIEPHVRGEASEQISELMSEQPGPLTVCRVLGQTDTSSVNVRTKTGASWRISTGNGTIEPAASSASDGSQ